MKKFPEDNFNEDDKILNEEFGSKENFFDAEGKLRNLFGQKEEISPRVKSALDEQFAARHKRNPVYTIIAVAASVAVIIAVVEFTRSENKTPEVVTAPVQIETKKDTASDIAAVGPVPAPEVKKETPVIKPKAQRRKSEVNDVVRVFTEETPRHDTTIQSGYAGLPPLSRPLSADGDLTVFLVTSL